jgi:hypothetical protein
MCGYYQIYPLYNQDLLLTISLSELRTFSAYLMHYYRFYLEL